MLAPAAIQQQNGRTAERCYEDVHPAVVVDVAEGGSAGSQRRGHARVRALETAAAIQRKQRQLLVVQRGVNLLDIIENVALRDEEILPAVIVEILQAHAPAGAARGQSA